MTSVTDEWADRYLRAQQPVAAPTWWVRINKGAATGPFRTQGAALRFLDGELIRMGHHGGCHVVGSFSGEGLEYFLNEVTREVERDRYAGASSEENLVATWSGGSAQIFKKVEKRKKEHADDRR